MGNASSPMIVLELREFKSTARSLGLEVETLEVAKRDDVPLAFEAAFKFRADALYVCSDPLLSASGGEIITLARGARLPTAFGEREYVDAGGLMSYGPNLPDLYRRAAEFVDKILGGAKPAELPVEQPTRFELVINLKTANDLGIVVPPTLLARADEVIE